ncbi:MAG: hypothetical protein OIF36_00395 [Alphaproteobacteria bacterium]|nr:hypothetical protein [Alphaproteobacteria bacterium]
MEIPKDINDIKLIKSNNNSNCFNFNKKINLARIKYLIKSKIKKARRFVIQIKLKKDVKIIRILGVYIINTNK